MSDPVLAPEWHQWRGGVDARLASHEAAMSALALSVSALDTKVDRVDTNVTQLLTRDTIRAASARTLTTWQTAVVAALIAGVFSLLTVVLLKTV